MRPATIPAKPPVKASKMPPSKKRVKKNAPMKYPVRFTCQGKDFKSCSSAWHSRRISPGSAGGLAQSRRDRALNRSIPSTSVLERGTRRSRVWILPSGSRKLTMRQLGMANTSPWMWYAARRRRTVSSAR